MYIVKGIAIIIIMLLCCMFVGKLWKRQGNLLEASLLGFATLLAIFQLICMPLGLAGQPFHVVCNLFLGILIGLVALSLVLSIVQRRKYTLFAYPKKFHLLLLFALILIIWQIVRQVAMEPQVYGDDTVYIGLVNDIRTSDVIQGRIPKSGADLALADTNLKYIFSCYYQFLAFWCRLFDFHPLLLMKTFLPILVGILSYGVFWLLAEFFFKEDMAKKSFFLFFVAMLVEFGNLTNHSFSRRMLQWTWNSKTILFTILLPLLFLLANRFAQEGKGMSFSQHSPDRNAGLSSWPIAHGNRFAQTDGKTVMVNPGGELANSPVKTTGPSGFRLPEILILAVVSISCGAATLTGLAFSLLMLFGVGLTRAILAKRGSIFGKILLSGLPTLALLFVVILFWKGALHV